MPDTFVRTRCSACGNVLRFEDFSAGGDRCLACARSRIAPSTEFVRGPRIRRTNARNRVPQAHPADDHYLDDIPQELINELVAALEAEAARRPMATDNPVRDVLYDIGLGRSTLEKQWAAWGFAGGFAANVLIAKYAQMSSSAPMSQFIGPMLLGGCLAGVACAAIGWGLAKLREPQAA
ncbi:MAG: hypothetical protein AB7J35_18235 [Dehalococcoidia bacterium]